MSALTRAEQIRAVETGTISGRETFETKREERKRRKLEWREVAR